MGSFRNKGCVSILLLAAGCSTEFTSQQCEVDDDCGAGLVCEMRDAEHVCIGSGDAPLLIGQSAPITGPNQLLGIEMKRGIELAFALQNGAGGIRGRELQLVFRDDGYDADQAEEAARQLVDVQEMETAPRCPTTATPAVMGQEPVSETALARGPNSVLAILGNVGTPTMVRSAPVAIETGTVFFGAFTGAKTILRDDRAGDCKKYIFNVRASYAQEAHATMEYFVAKAAVDDYRHLISFDQNDSFGQAGYDGLVAGYIDELGDFPSTADAVNPIVRFRYTRNDAASIPAQVDAAEDYLAGLLDDETGVISVGVMMTDTYGAGAEFIESVRRWQFANDAQQAALDKANRLKLYFSNVSFVGPNALAYALVEAGTVNTPEGPMAFTENVVVSQVVPNYESDATDVIRAYNEQIEEAGFEPSFTSLEGYISGLVFVAGLESNPGAFTPDALVAAFESMPDLSLGIGATSGFSASVHQYSNSVWGTSIQPDGSFRNLYFWQDGTNIQFFE